MYTRFLGNSFSAPATIKNYLSGAKLWVRHHLGISTAFSASEPSDVYKRVAASLNHTPSRAYALTPEDIRIICRFLDAKPSIPLGVKACILQAYTSFLRSSNLVSPSMSSWSGPHTLRACDIIDTADGICLVVYSTKTRLGNKPVFIHVTPTYSPLVCPVTAWKLYREIIRPPILGPAFLQNDFTPLTPRPIVALMRLALGSVGHPNAMQVTMHSL